MSRHALATAALAEWSLQHLVAREQAAQAAAAAGQPLFGEQHYVAAASNLVLLCSLCRPATCPGALDIDLSDFCRNIRAVLDAAAAHGAPNTMLVTQLESGIIASPEVRQSVLAYAVLTLLAALEARPLCITVCLCRADDVLSLEIAADAVPESDTALQRLAQADVIARETGGDLETDSWLLPWSKQLSLPQPAAVIELTRAPARA